MAVEDADDLAAFFDADEFGLTASFTPSGGSLVQVTVVLYRPRDISNIGLAGLAQYNTSVHVRHSEVPTPDNGVWVINGTSYRTAEATLDDTGSIWTCHLQPTT